MAEKNTKDLELGATQQVEVIYAEAVPVSTDAYYASSPPAHGNYAYNPAVVNPAHQQPPQQQFQQQQQHQQQPMQGFVVQQQQQPQPQPHQVYHQQQQQPIVVVMQQPQQSNSQQLLTLGSQGASGSVPVEQRPLRGAWITGLCECFEQILPSCACAWCCSCVLLGKVTDRLKTHTFNCLVGGFFIALILESVLNGVGVPIPFSSLYMIFFTAETRTKMRQALNIPGNGCEDCLVSVFCMPCTLAQMARQVFAYRGPFDCDGCNCGPDHHIANPSARA